MGLLNQLGVPENIFGGGVGGGALMWIGIIFLAFVILIVAGVITFLFYFKKAKKNAFKNLIPIFQTINGKRTRIGVDNAKEMFVPDTNVSLFFLNLFLLVSISLT